MDNSPDFRSAPWDRKIFGVDCNEILVCSAANLEAATRIPGHYTVKVDPLTSKELLARFGFYYCDTLLQPQCKVERFRGIDDSDVSLSHQCELEDVLRICHGAFSHGRFHRDFNLPKDLSDRRYDNWLAQLHAEGKVYGVQYKGELAAFIAVEEGTFVLHAVKHSLRGKGLARKLWTPVCRAVYALGFPLIDSSISATNLAVLNLYASLGFQFSKPVDVYHRLTT